MVQHMIDQYEFAATDLEQSVQNTLEEEPDMLPYDLVNLADEMKEMFMHLKNKLAYYLKEKTYQAEVGGPQNHPAAWANLAIDTLRMTQNEVKDIRNDIIKKSSAMGTAKTDPISNWIDEAHYMYADPGNM